jgi:hypothetical protein
MRFALALHFYEPQQSVAGQSGAQQSTCEQQTLGLCNITKRAIFFLESPAKRGGTERDCLIGYVQWHGFCADDVRN